MTKVLEPVEIISYRRRITGESWIAAGVLGAGLAVFGLWNWTIGLLLGLCLGLVNFFLLCRQTARIQQTVLDRAKGGMILGHWARFLLMGCVIYLVYRKETVSFPAFLAGLVLVYGVIFVDGFLRARKKEISES